MPSNEARSSVRPNAARRAAYVLALIGRECATCLLPIAWDMASGDAREAGSATLGHVIDIDVCRAFNTEVIDAQCWACNWSAKAAGITNQSGDWQVRPYSLPRQKVADAWRATRTPEDASSLPGWSARKAARHARGIAW